MTTKKKIERDEHAGADAHMRERQYRLRMLIGLGDRYEPNIHLPCAMLALDAEDVAVLHVASDILTAKVLPQMMAHADCDPDECGIFDDEQFQFIIQIMGALYYLTEDYAETVGTYLAASGLGSLSALRREIAKRTDAEDMAWFRRLFRALDAAGHDINREVEQDAARKQEWLARQLARVEPKGFDA